LNPIFGFTNKPGNDGGIFANHTGIITKKGSKSRGRNRTISDIQCTGVKFLSNIRRHGEVDIAPGFDFDSVYFVGVNNILLEECCLDKCPCRPLSETEINLS
jgi:hypothetical protein